MKVISFSLWGNNSKYCVGALRNAKIARRLFPDWVCRFYVGTSVPKSILVSLMQDENLENGFGEWPTMLDVERNIHTSCSGRTQIVLMPESGDWRGMFWRFQAINDPDCEIMISRDCDSRLSLREKAAVDEWLASGRGFHIMRDHPWHGSQILGGMFGIKKNCLPEFGTLMDSWKQEDRWQTDQDFLNTVVYPRVVHNSMIHASFLRMEPHARDFPVPRNGTEFVGQVFDENENTVAEHLTALVKAL